MTKQTVKQAAMMAAVVWIASAVSVNAASRESAKARQAARAKESIVVEPRVPPRPPTPPDYGFDVDIWTDKRVYELGDLVRIYFRVTRPCYVYIFDTDTRGETHQLFPNYYDRDNHSVPRRTYFIPDRNYRLRVTGPPGTERLRIVAVRDRPVLYDRHHPFGPRDPFPLYPEGADGFLREYKREKGPGSRDKGSREDRPRVRGSDRGAEGAERRSPLLTRRAEAGSKRAETIVVEPGEPRTIVVEPGYYDRDYAEAQTTIRVVDPYSRPRPVYFGKLEVTSRPQGARVTVDGILRGYTPLTIRALEPGYHDVRVSLPGYVSWSRELEVLEGRTVHVQVRLRRREPRIFFDFHWGW